jgi:Gas vesicle synthesis protein GvpL/GvpF
VIYLYALTEPGAEFSDRRGLDDQPLSMLELGGVCAAYSEHDRLDLAPTSDALWQHDQVVEHLMASASTLPVRFGTTFADLDGLLAATTPKLAAVRERLEQVRGCVELAVRVEVPATGGEPPRSGRAYLESRLEHAHRREATARAALAPLEKLAVRARELRRARPGIISASFLVRARDVDSFATEVRSLQRRGERRLSCTGPWPPYSFADLEERA